MDAIARQRGFALQRLRESRGLTQQELGEAIGVHQSTVDRYESGTYNLKVDTLLRIVAALDCSLGDLLEPAEGRKE